MIFRILIMKIMMDIYSIKCYGQTSPMRCVTPRSAPAPKFSGNFWTPASKPLWPTRDPKFPGNFGAWAVPFERLGLFDGRKPDSLP